MQDEKSPLYLFVDSVRERLDKDIHLVVLGVGFYSPSLVKIKELIKNSYSNGHSEISFKKIFHELVNYSQILS